MRKFFAGFLIAAGLLVSPVLAQAESAFFVTPKLGTLGFGVDLGYQVNDLFKVRLNGNYFGWSFDGNVQDIDYDIDLKNLTFGLLFDLHPFSNGFRVTAGAYYLNIKGDLSGGLKQDQVYSFGDHKYLGSELGEASGTAKWSRIAPYIGLGWGSGKADPDSNWFFSFDLGAMYAGKSKLSYTVSGLASHPSLAADIEREKQEVQSKLDDYKWYPVLSVGLVYRF